MDGSAEDSFLQQQQHQLAYVLNDDYTNLSGIQCLLVDLEQQRGATMATPPPPTVHRTGRLNIPPSKYGYFLPIEEDPSGGIKPAHILPRGLTPAVHPDLERCLPSLIRPPYLQPTSPDQDCPPLQPPHRPFIFREHHEWGIDFYIRVDHAGYHHIYPHVGAGPFRTMQEANHAMLCYLRRRVDPKMLSTDGSAVDKVVRQSLYWPDGTRKRKHPKSPPIDESRDRHRQLAYALVAKYNDDHNLSRDLAYLLKDVVQYEITCEACAYHFNIYHHINFIAKTKGADHGGIDDGSDLFFAEVLSMQRDELSVICLCKLKPADNGGCYGCFSSGNVDLKHPSDVGYLGGVVVNTMGLQHRQPRWDPEVDVDEGDEAEEARLRHHYRFLDNPDLIKAMMAPLPPL